MKVTILGSGTSSGVPTIGCQCATCTSTDPRDQRLRTSVWVQVGETSLLIDTSADFRQQCLRAGIKQLDAVIYTHHHFDHIAGFDDLRAFNFVQGQPVPIYVRPDTHEHMSRVFAYAFEENPANKSSRPLIDLNIISNTSFQVKGIEILPIPLFHGGMEIFGYRIDRFAYCTDCNNIPEHSLSKLRGLDVLILDALRYTAHPTHFTLDEAIEIAGKIGATNTYLTHLAHDIRHEFVERQLPPGLHLAYDGLELSLA